MHFKLNALWKRGSLERWDGPVHVSMNDYWVHRLGDVLRVARVGLGLRARWPQMEGALGLWVAAFALGRRQVSISAWRAPEDLRRFVHSPEHARIMRDFKGVGALRTIAWTAEQLDPELIWRQGLDRLDQAMSQKRTQERS